ncbi:DUF5640 domain-containing protein [Rufibacter latericius]|uniref:Lipocalin-like domain-containing protein n=1 Tax=Rufibacter latericius TaxID=2487040 RepID=A0A3M9MDL0_9BACT|nr:DUF5640 domain-containing protein [Rufibacter latericius]RNI23639.1 hypothetical protein EFB08_19120 [Rufibacter latericius]
MKNTSYLLTILTAFTLVFTSCSKDDDKDEPKPSIEAQLSQKTWELDEHEVQFDGQSPQDVMDIVHEQAGTDDIAFKLDGKGEFALILDGDEEENGEYEIDGDKIIWNYPLTYTWAESDDDIHDYEFELNGNTLTLTSKSTNLDGNEFEETITFKVR